jgi:acylphosphatase
MAEKVRARFVVSGAVQGVFYRVSCREEAVRLQLDGWVQNLSDGRVEGVAEGSREKIELLLAWCRRGPRSARVQEVQVTWEPSQGEKGFQISG